MDNNGSSIAAEQCLTPLWLIKIKYNGKHLSDYYVAWSSSFYPAHHISTGEGGIVCTSIEDLKKAEWYLKKLITVKEKK